MIIFSSWGSVQMSGEVKKKKNEVFFKMKIKKVRSNDPGEQKKDVEVK